MKVTVYSAPHCPYCTSLKKFFLKQKVDFVDIDVTVDTEKANEMIKKSGQMGVPVTDINGEIVIGFDKEKIEELLKK